MKMRKILYKAAAMVLGLSMLLTGCGASGDADEEPELPSAELSVTETPMITDPRAVTMIRDGKVENPLTGT